MCFFQVTKERVKLLSHPLVTYLLRYKWRSFGRYVYYGRLILYGIFLFFLTGYAMHTTKSIPMTVCKERECTCNVSFDTGTPGSRVVWRKIGLPVILITTSISIFLEVRNLHRYRQQKSKTFCLDALHVKCIECRVLTCLQLFRERKKWWEKMCTRQSRKVIWDMIIIHLHCS